MIELIVIDNPFTMTRAEHKKLYRPVLIELSGPGLGRLRYL